ncbi:hypothetical protein SM124_04670 (plasmid) [Bacillus sp. 31A1R]|uniref:Uncharacterized protein n=1 Tax=Robertmurraya mangrovi TaxID=3098077 RepID=A0ABU5IV87_9BACI|nr:hypothetical protein [Bacillus sp. 31A1R]MDZ5471040.1 hypothetical protein [Bacillus sp. 31A1R]
MVNENKDEFFKHQREAKYLAGARDNREKAQADPKYNNRNESTLSPGVTGRE